MPACFLSVENSAEALRKLQRGQCDYGIPFLRDCSIPSLPGARVKLPWLRESDSAPSLQFPKTWNQSHHLLFMNDGMSQNLRSYFDRPREPPHYTRGRKRVKLTPTWTLRTLNVAEERSLAQTTASMSEASVSKYEGKWDSRFNVLFRNSGYHTNFRSYFDRSRKFEGALEKGERLLPTWSLQEYKVTPTTSPRDENLDETQASDGFLSPRPTWCPRHQIMYSKKNGELHPSYRSYFDRKLSLENPPSPRGIAARITWRL
eukprot:GEMP01061358.1.p1 GENE.GEMP01061358.1~~GEMP01061358.1.p1  ORF type:complete len:260 (+),score=19.14 GEMP01061358.1:22-801(+)